MDLKDIDDHLELSESNINITLQSMLSSITIKNSINVSDSIYTDTTIDKWITKLPITRGGAIVMDKIIKNPTNDKDLLLKRHHGAEFGQVQASQILIMKFLIINYKLSKIMKKIFYGL